MTRVVGGVNVVAKSAYLFPINRIQRYTMFERVNTLPARYSAST